MAEVFDPRVTPARPDLAAAHLRGHVDAARFVDGTVHGAGRGHAGLYAAPDPGSEMVSEVLKGDVFTVYDRVGAMVWGQAASDGYVGWLAGDALGPVMETDARICVPMAPLFARPDVKAPVRDALPMGARVCLDGGVGDYLRLGGGDGYVHRRHVVSSDQVEPDFVVVAERFAGVPYLWGGKTFAGLDCSGLVQTALAAAGVQAPRDSDMQARTLGRAAAPAAMARGDLVFWQGHAGIVLDGARFLHANAFFMQVTIEPLADALARNESLCGPVTAVRRL